MTIAKGLERVVNVEVDTRFDVNAQVIVLTPVELDFATCPEAVSGPGVFHMHGIVRHTIRTGLGIALARFSVTVILSASGASTGSQYCLKVQSKFLVDIVCYELLVSRIAHWTKAPFSIS